MSVMKMNELKAFFTFFHQHRLSAVEGTKAWSLFGATITEHGEKVLGWRPPERVAERSVREAHIRTRGWARSLRDLAAVMAAAPGASPKTVAVAEVVTDRVPVSGTAALMLAAVDEAEQDRADLRGLLVHLPSPALEFFEAWIEQGRGLERAVARRFTAQQASRSSVPRGFVSRTVGLLGEFRRALRHETRADPALPEELDRYVFDYWDSLRSQKTQGARGTHRGHASPPAFANTEHEIRDHETPPRGGMEMLS